MKATFLGTGTSVGIPAIGCECAVCRSGNSRNKRRRSSLYLAAGETHLVVDTPPDFREQALAYRIPRVDAVLFTHSHADHIFGFDDIRRYNSIQEAVIPAYASAASIADLKRVFNYIGQEKVPGVYRPRIEYREVTEPFALGDALQVTPLPVEHGDKVTHGYRFDHAGRSLGYIPDCHVMPDTTLALLRGVDVVILNALRDRPHVTHMTVEQSLALLGRIQAGTAYLVHMCHDLDHDELQSRMPASVHVSYDGLVVDV